MSKKRGYRADVTTVDETIPTEVIEEVIPKNFMNEPEEAAAEEVSVETKPIYTVKHAATVIAHTLNVRKRPSADSEIVKVIRFKDYVEVLDESTANGWYPVLLADGTKGYCMSKFIKLI